MRFRPSCARRRAFALKWFCPLPRINILPFLVTLRRFENDLLVLVVMILIYEWVLLLLKNGTEKLKRSMDNPTDRPSLVLSLMRIDTSLPLPQYQTQGAVGFDLYARIPTLIKPRAIERVPANVIIAVPNGYVLFIIARSSLPAKRGLMLANGVGVIDHDYCGKMDEIHVQVYNLLDKDVLIERGERIAQAIVSPVAKVEFNESNQFPSQSRGGFGSTGTH